MATGLRQFLIALFGGMVLWGCSPSSSPAPYKPEPTTTNLESSTKDTSDDNRKSSDDGEESSEPLADFCEDGDADCDQEYFFLLGAFETSNNLNPNTFAFQTATAYSVKINNLKRNDRLYFTTTTGFTNQDNRTTDAIVRMKVKNGDSLSEQRETLSQNMGEVTLATAGMIDVPESGNQSYLVQMEAGAGDLQAAGGNMVAMVYRKLPLADAVSGKEEGYFFLGFQKTSSVASESLSSGDDGVELLSKATNLREGDLVVATTLMSWKSIQEESAPCVGAEIQTEITLNGESFAKPAGRIIDTDSVDATLRASKIYRAEEGGEVKFALEAGITGGDCDLEVKGHSSMLLYIFRPFRYLEDSFGQAYALFNSGIVNLESKTLATSGTAEKVNSAVDKSFDLGAGDVLFYETFANIGADDEGNGNAGTTTLMQLKRSQAEKYSSIGRAQLSGDREHSTLYAADALYTEKATTETIESNFSAINQNRDPVQIKSLKFMYHQFRLLPKPR